MTLQDFIYSRERKTRILRHLTVWLLLYIFAVCTYPPKGSGTLYGRGMDGFLIFYRMVFIRTFLMILAQMLFAYGSKEMGGAYVSGFYTYVRGMCFAFT